MPIEVINPATGETIRTYEPHTDADIESTLQKAADAFDSWRQTTFAQRSAVLHKAASQLRKRAASDAIMMAQEMGKPVTGGRSESDKCAWVCEFYAENAEAFLDEEPVETDASASFVTYQPLGPVLAVMPWNYPYWQVFRFAAPALMAGNVGILKHAANVPGCAEAIEEIFLSAGLPEGCFQNLLVGSEKVAGIIADERVVATTLTGSTGAGRAVAKKSGECLKKTVLELGGSDPYLVLRDADIPLAAEKCAQSRMINGGQSCIAAKRFFVEEPVLEEFTDAFVKCIQDMKVGDPMDPDTKIGPMARADLRDEIHEQVTKSVKNGGKLALGGEKPDGPGAFYPPTVVTHVGKGMPVHDEETFGPVAAVRGVASEEEAIAAANDTVFGLGAAIFTSDVDKGRHIAKHRLHAGACFVNSFVKSDPRLPFGGIKESGYGRELGPFGIREFTNIKAVWVD